MIQNRSEVMTADKLFGFSRARQRARGGAARNAGIGRSAGRQNRPLRFARLTPIFRMIGTHVEWVSQTRQRDAQRV